MLYTALWTNSCGSNSMVIMASAFTGSDSIAIRYMIGGVSIAILRIYLFDLFYEFIDIYYTFGYTT